MTESDRKLRIVFAGGGTAGHLFPGLAVAQELRAQAPSTQIAFLGTGKDLERSNVVSSGYFYLGLPSRPLPSGPGAALRFVIDNIAGYRAARRFLRSARPDVVVGLGGYASVPTARAAIRLKIPLVLLEQNAVPGRATRWSAPRARLICAAFDETRAQLPETGPIHVTGNPIRSGFARLDETRLSSEYRKQLVVLGGSSGAQALNEQVPRALYKMRKHLSGWSIVHQCGARDAGATTTLYRKFDLDALVTPFVRDMPRLLNNTSLAISRAGGTTLAELAAAGVPAILLPYPFARDQHQRANAEVFVAGGAAHAVDQIQTRGRLDNAIVAATEDLLVDPLPRRAMAEAMTALARPNAAWDVATMVMELAAIRRARQVA